MCKSKASVLAAPPRHRSNFKSSSAASPSGDVSNDADNRRRRLPPTSTSSGNSSATKPSSSSSASASASSSAFSLASLRGALHEAPVIYPFPELCAATKNFLAKRLPGASSSAWRCTLRGRDAVVIQRPLRRRYLDVPSRLGDLGRSHHGSLARLLGASTSGDNVYLVYEFVPGASLAGCLRNPRNSGFTPLASWVSRVQVAADVAQGLEYIHCHSSAVAGVHNRVKSSAIIVTQPDLRAKICHFGAADLAGEVPDPVADEADITSISSPTTRKGSGERQIQIEGTRGYMAPELLADGAVSRSSDVFALGVLLLELVSGEEPLKYLHDKERKVFEVVSLVDTAREAVGGEGEGKEEEEERRGRVRQWVDRRLRDSFPVEAADKLITVALRCVEAEAAARPDMTWVAGKVSKLYLESKVWAERVSVPTDFSVSIAPR
ncbi:Protein tyrosine kinase [Musa troglodytarum]|uniref:Protein tyrosine kinase n=1 Tax=Musa troglodytarum TaxID=320322 RepID=A0A9E7IDM8_9LILI|nr:Protein tyrosine kinase [Musa troglodytarum]